MGLVSKTLVKRLAKKRLEEFWGGAEPLCRAINPDSGWLWGQSWRASQCVLVWGTLVHGPSSIPVAQVREKLAL